MSEKARFHSMTKPVKFRRLKIMKQYTKLWCRTIRERTIYLFNYLLYKLNILKRYSYRDTSVQVLPLPHQVLVQRAKSSNFAGEVIMHLVLETDIDLDYFYKEKNGEKKVTLYLNNKEETRLFAESHLEKIHMRFDKWYYVDSLPTFKVANLRLDKDAKPYDPTEPLKESEYSTVTYNVDYLKKLTHKSLIGVNMIPEDISEPMLHYYYNFAVGEFNKHFNSLTLNDLKM